LTFVIGSILYGLISIPVNILTGLERFNILANAFFCVVYQMTITSMMFSYLVNILEKHISNSIPFDKIVFSLNLKIRTNVIISVLCTFIMMIFNIFMLLKSYTNAGQLLITNNEFLMKISTILIILSIVQILPLFFVTKPIFDSIQLIKGFTRKFAAGDLTSNLEYETLDDLAEVTRDLNQFGAMFRNAISMMGVTSDNLDDATNKLNSISSGFNQVANNLAASSEELAASIEEMTSNIELSSSQAVKSKDLSVRAQSEIEEGYKNVLNTLDSINEIIAKLASISEIAGQTHLLAINASIEAANAGTAGKGFTVVAQEVRKLSESTTNIAEQINILSNICLTNSQVSESKIKSVVPVIQNTTKFSDELAISSLEQRQSSQQMNQVIQQYNQSVQHFAISSDDLLKQSKMINNQSTEIKQLISNFKI